jgi:hypothetical protein
VKELAGFAASAGAGVSVRLVGAPWWAVVLVVLVVLVSTYGVVCWLMRNPRVKRVTTFLITVDTSEPEEPPPKSEVA